MADRSPIEAMDGLTPNPRPRLAPTSIFLTALWVGLLTGAAELGMLAVREAMGIRISIDLLRLNKHALWMIPASDALLFGLAGLVLAGLARFSPRLARRVPLVLLGMLAFWAILERVPGLHEVARVTLASGIGFHIARKVSGRLEGASRLIRWTLPAMVLLAAGGGLVSYVRITSAEARALAAHPAPPPGAKNILLLVMDTVRADHMSLYGYERATTPNLDRLAASAVKFEHARSTAPWTLPSHASLLTGRWPHQLSADADHAMNRRFPTLAEFLGSQGYATAGFVANTYYCNDAYGLGRGFAHYEDCDEKAQVSTDEILLSSGLGRLVVRAGSAAGLCVSPEASQPKDARRINRDTLAWIDAHRDRPFFAFLNYVDAHDPYLLPEGEDHHFGLKPETPADFATLRGWHERDKRTVSEREVTLVRDAYDDCIASLDAQIAQLFDELGKRGLRENTVIVVTSDHGEQFGERLFYGHGRSLYREELHVPLLVFSPDVPSGRVVNEPVSLRDLPATVGDLAGLDVHDPFPGRSLLATWTGPGSPASMPVLAEVAHRPTITKRDKRPPAWLGPMALVLHERNVYIRNGNGEEELYDLTTDPSETRNLADEPASDVVLDSFRATLARLRRETW